MDTPQENPNAPEPLTDTEGERGRADEGEAISSDETPADDDLDKDEQSE